MILSAKQVHTLAYDALVLCGTSEVNANLVANALLAAELADQAGHGLRRLESYCAQAQSGKVDGHAVPTLEKVASATLKVDAAHGFSYPALDLVLQQLPQMARQFGIAIAGVKRSHHCGVVGVEVEKYADMGLVALMFANSPAAIAPWGGSAGLFGTNPIAFAAPQKDAPPIVIDVSLSKVARGKVIVAQQKGEAIPEGWALGPDGEKTTDPEVAMKGTMVPMGDAKGTALALMVELLAASLNGADSASELSSFVDTKGASPKAGQTIIAIDPTKLGGELVLRYFSDLANKITAQEGARVPGDRRHKMKQQFLTDGISVDADLVEQIKKIGR
ncbi:MAG: Ldh family oxidoreductase [Rhizobiaceae bacterium]